MKRGCLTLAVLAVAVAVVVVLFGPRLLEGGLRLLYPQRYTELVEREAAEFDLEPNLVYAIIKTESGFDPQARSHADAMGLMQLTQETFDWILSLYPTEDGSGQIADVREGKVVKPEDVPEIRSAVEKEYPGYTIQSVTHALLSDRQAYKVTLQGSGDLAKVIYMLADGTIVVPKMQD